MPNLSELRAKLASLQSGSEKVKNLWKPSASHVIRLVPFADGDIFKELQFHYNLVKGKTVISPLTFQERDPVDEFADKLQSSGTKEDYKAAMQMRPKMRCYAAVLVRGEEHEGVKFWGFGKQTYEQLLTLITDPDYGDISDLEKGRDLKITFVPGSGATLPSTTIISKPNATVATEDPKVLDLIKNQSDLMSNWKRYTYSEIKNFLQASLETEDGETEVRVNTPPTAASFDVTTVPSSGLFDEPKKSTSSKKQSTTDNLDAKLEEMFSK
jgi:hypothetical protein